MLELIGGIIVNVVSLALLAVGIVLLFKYISWYGKTARKLESDYNLPYGCGGQIIKIMIFLAWSVPLFLIFLVITGISSLFQ